MKRLCLTIFICLSATMLINCSKNDHAKNTTDDLPTVDVVKIERKSLTKTIHLPGDFHSFEFIDVYPKLSGYIDKLYVDRGSIVKKGDILANLSAPELDKQIQEAEANYLSANDQYQRAHKMNQTYISAGQEKVLEEAAQAAKNKMESLQAQKNYLSVKAPFEGVIIKRYLHNGALVFAGGTSNAVPLFKLGTINKLRLVVAVPEANIDTIKLGNNITFTVTAYPDRVFPAKISRFSNSLNLKTRTEAVELDIDNPDHVLLPGMYADVNWPATRVHPTFVVPLHAVVTTTYKTFVIRVKNGFTEWIDVQRGNANNKDVEIFGELNPGDEIVVPGTDELKQDTKVKTKVMA